MARWDTRRQRERWGKIGVGDETDAQNEWPVSWRWLVTCPFGQQPAKEQDRQTNGRDKVALQVSQVGAET